MPSADEALQAREQAGSDLKVLLDKEKVPQATQDHLFFAGVDSVRTYASIAKDESDFREVLLKDFAISPAAFQNRLIIGKLLTAFTVAKARAQKMALVDAEKEAMELPKMVVGSEFTAMRKAFEARFWKLENARSPSKQLIERLTDTVEKNEWRPERLEEITDYTTQDLGTLKTVLDPEGNVKAVKAKATIPLPTDTESFRTRITLLGTSWVMVSLAQPGTAVLQGLTPQLFNEYLDYLLGEQVLQLGFRKDAKVVSAGPSWDLFLNYEFEIRNEAYTNVMRHGTPYDTALRAAWKDTVVKERYLTTPLGLEAATRGQGTSNHAPGVAPKRPALQDVGADAAAEAKRRKKAEKNAKTRARKEAAAANAAARGAGAPPPQLAVGGKGKGRGKGKDKGANGLSAKTPDGKSICFPYAQQGRCNRGAGCPFEHCCQLCYGRHPNAQCA